MIAAATLWVLVGLFVLPLYVRWLALEAARGWGRGQRPYRDREVARAQTVLRELRQAETAARATLAAARRRPSTGPRES